MIVLQLLFIALPFLFAFTLGLALPILTLSLYNRFGVGLMLIATTFVVDAMFMGQGGLPLGINLFIADLGLIPIAGIAILRMLVAKDFPLRHSAWLLFCALVVASLVAGLMANGSAAGVQARPYFYFIATGLYAMSFPMDDRRVRQALTTLVTVAILLLVLTGYRWIVYYTPMPDLLPAGGTYNIDGPIRVIKSNETLVLAEVLICGIFFTAASRSLRFAQLLLPVLCGFVIALQHRSVWLAVLIAILVRFLIVRSRNASSTRQFVMLLAIAGFTAIPMVASDRLAGVAQQVEMSTQRALQGADTTGERLNNWKAVVRQWYEGGPKSIGIGMGFGTDNSRYVENVGSFGVHKAAYFAHNMYVQTLFNTGVLGLAALLTAFAYVLRGLYRLNRSGETGIETQVLMVLIAMQVAYYVPYGTDYLQSLVFGVALSFVAGRLPKPVKPLTRAAIRGRLA